MIPQLLTQFSKYLSSSRYLPISSLSPSVLLQGLGSRHWCWKLVQGKNLKALGFQILVLLFPIFVTPPTDPWPVEHLTVRAPIAMGAPLLCHPPRKDSKSIWQRRSSSAQRRWGRATDCHWARHRSAYSHEGKRKGSLHWRLTTVMHLIAYK